MKVSLIGVTTTYNCERLVPFVMKYHEALDYDKFIVFDNESTDNTVELLKQYPFVEVHNYNSNGVFSDEIKSMVLRDACQEIIQKTFFGDTITWVNCCDFDEVIYFPYHQIAKNSFRSFLGNASKCGYNVISDDIIDIFNENFSEKKLDTNIFAHKQLKYAAYGAPFFWNKPSFFRADICRSFIFHDGNHNVEYDFFEKPIMPIQNCRDIFRFHLKYIFGKEYVSKVFKEYTRENDYKSDFIEKFIKRNELEFEDYFENISFLLTDYIKNKRLNGKNLLNENNFPENIK